MTPAAETTDAPPAATNNLVTVAALCGLEPTAEGIRINRKFHTGMCEYATRLSAPVACLLPRMSPAEAAASVDLVAVPKRDLPYEVHWISGRDPAPADAATIGTLVARSALVYCQPAGGVNWAVVQACLARGVPYIVTTEFTLRTELDIMRATTGSPFRRLRREISVRRAFRRQARVVAAAAEFHANGYPTYHAFAVLNPHRLLFFDTRVRSCDLIPPPRLERRLDDLARGQRPPRLIFTGRYHPMKGTLDVVKAGIELRRRGCDFRLELYGAGPLRPQLEALVAAAGAGANISINDPVPFSPDLIERLRDSDLFLCCHVQGDPSCTYLETFACGVPIAGYANEMWTPLCRESGGGIETPCGDYRALADAVAHLFADPPALRRLTHRARDFASRHTMESAFACRTSRIESLIAAPHPAAHHPHQPALPTEPLPTEPFPTEPFPTEPRP